MSGGCIKLVKWPCLLDFIFSGQKERVISGDEFKGKITFKEKDSTNNNSKAADFDMNYFTLIESRKEGTIMSVMKL